MFQMLFFNSFAMMVSVHFSGLLLADISGKIPASEDVVFVRDRM